MRISDWSSDVCSSDLANSFVITNPIPDQMVYAGTDTPGEVVSVDGGRSSGPIAEMKVADADGVERTAMPADVTHVRWVINRAMPTGGGGPLSFRAVLRELNHPPSRVGNRRTSWRDRERQTSEQTVVGVLLKKKYQKRETHKMT